MLTKDKLRRIEVLHDGNWTEVHLGQIEPGEEFRIFEPDGSPVTSEGVASWVAVSNASIPVRGPTSAPCVPTVRNNPDLNPEGSLRDVFEPASLTPEQLQGLVESHEMHMLNYLELAWSDDMGSTAEDAQRARDKYDQALAAAADHAAVLTALLALKIGATKD